MEYTTPRHRAQKEGVCKMANIVEEVKNLDCGEYYLSVSEYLALSAAFGFSIDDAPIEYFKAGFIKGQRAEKARHKTKDNL